MRRLRVSALALTEDARWASSCRISFGNGAASTDFRLNPRLKNKTADFWSAAFG